MLKKWDLSNQSRTIQFIAAIVTAVIGGLLFNLIKVPIPWLLGPMAALLIASRLEILNFIGPLQLGIRD